MKRKVVGLFIAGLVMGTLLTGCDKQENTALTETTVESSVTGSEVSESSEYEPVASAETQEVIDQNSGEPEATPEPEAEAKIEIVNNNGHFVQVDGKVYFHIADADFMDRSSLWGKYLSTEAGRTVLMAYDGNSGEVKPVAYDYASGVMAVEGDIFYSNSYFDDFNNEDGYTNYGVSGRTTAGESVELGGLQDTLLGVTTDGSYLVTYHYSYEDNVAVKYVSVYQEGTLVNKIDTEEFVECVKLGEDCIFYRAKDEEGAYSLMQMKVSTGEKTNLGQLPEMDGYGGVVDECQIADGKIFLTYSLYEGTGHFFSGGYYVEAQVGKADSLTAQNMPSNDDEYGDPHYAPFAIINGKMVQSDGIPGTCYVSEDGMLGYYNEQGTWVPVSSEFAYEELENEDNISVELAELIGDSIYVITNYNERVPEDDIGWRYAYRRKYSYVYRVNVQTGEKEEILCQTSPRG